MVTKYYKTKYYKNKYYNYETLFYMLTHLSKHRIS